MTALSRDGSPPPVPAPASSPPSRTAIYLSAFVCPGAGQLVQKRWLPALVFGGGFIASFIYFIISAAHILIAFYSLAFRPDSVHPEHLPKAEMLLSALACLLIYAINVADAFHGYRRARHLQAQARLNARMRDLIGETDAS